MNLKLVIAENCPACLRAKQQLKDFHEANPDLKLSIEKITEFKKQKLSIVPALFINDELFAYGEIDSNKLTEIINQK